MLSVAWPYYWLCGWSWSAASWSKPACVLGSLCRIGPCHRALLFLFYFILFLPQSVGLGSASSIVCVCVCGGRRCPVSWHCALFRLEPCSPGTEFIFCAALLPPTPTSSGCCSVQGTPPFCMAVVAGYLDSSPSCVAPRQVDSCTLPKVNL